MSANVASHLSHNSRPLYSLTVFCSMAILWKVWISPFQTQNDQTITFVSKKR